MRCEPHPISGFIYRELTGGLIRVEDAEKGRHGLFKADGSWIEGDLTRVLIEEGIGGIAFCPLAQGLLTNRYLNGIPADARAARDPRFLKPEHITEEKLVKLRQLDAIARGRGQSLAHLALVWVLCNPAITSALIGASKVSQIEENLAALKNPQLSRDELAAIDRIVGS